MAEHEMPVPGYRRCLGDFIATLFETPHSYLFPKATPDYTIPIAVQSRDDDATRWTFEVRFAEMVSLDLPILAVFLPHVVAVERWAKQMVRECERRNVTWRTYGTHAGLEWDQLLQLSSEFLQEMPTRSNV